MKREEYSIHIKLLVVLLITVSISLILVLFNLFQVFALYNETYGVIERPVLEFLIILLLLIVVLLAFTIVISVKEYHNRIIIRRSLFYSNHPNLKLVEIFENEHRKDILRCILNNPGIHHNELLRLCNLKKGQLQWHLYVLLDYDIIRKEKFGQYTIYFPYVKAIDKMESMVSGLTKSEMTSNILEIIKDRPGITSSDISKRFNIARNSVKYHIDKLIKKDLISFKKSGRKKKLYAL
jgi:predicted transcriptional regulator